MEPEIKKAPIRFCEIDFLRFLAAFSVVLNHYTWRLAVGERHYTDISFTYIASATKYGLFGVQLFFVISGYVVLMSAYGKTVKQFFISRITRLYPAFWVACSFTFIIEYLSGLPLFNFHVSDYFINMTIL